jgi:hypothetical protein
MRRNGLLSKRDLMRLSAYIDGQLSPRQRAEVEARLEVEPAFSQALAELERVVAAIGSLEPVVVPRNFMLTPEMAGVRRPSRSYPLLQFATAISALAFVALIGIDFFGTQGSAWQLASRASEQTMFESAPAVSDEIQENAGAALFAAGEQAAEEPLEEVLPPAAAALEGEAPAEAESGIAEDAMKLSATPVPTASAEERAAAPETGALEQTAPAVGEAKAAETDLSATAVSSAVYRAEQDAAQGLDLLLAGEILTGTFALLMGLFLFYRRRAT